VPGANRSDAAADAPRPVALEGVAEPRRERVGDGGATRGAVPVGLSEMSRFAPHDAQKRFDSPTGAAQEGQVDAVLSDSTIRRYDTLRSEIPVFRPTGSEDHLSAAENRSTERANERNSPIFMKLRAARQLHRTAPD
jgi:hypothetical protein